MTETQERIFMSILIAIAGFVIIPEMATHFTAERGIMDVGFAASLGFLSYLGLAFRGRS